MSTRCQIGFYAKENTNLLKPNALIYRHSDGHPGTPDGDEPGVLPDILPFLDLFNTRRGCDDTECCAAWLLYHLIARHVERGKKFAAEHPQYADISPEDGVSCIGFGICDSFHGDIEYFYAVHADRVDVYGVNMPWDKPHTLEHFKKLKTYKIGKVTGKKAA